jgi:hypothetical protein
MKEDQKTDRASRSVEKIALHNLVLVQTLAELLVERGLLDGDEIKERLKKIMAETSLNFERVQQECMNRTLKPILQSVA